MKKLPSIYTVSLNSSIDYTFYLKDIIDEEVNRIEKFRIDPGGKGINIVRMLKKLGEDGKCITFLGKNNGKFYENLLKKEKINFIPVKITGDLRNIYNFISKKKVLRFNEKGPKIKKEEIKKFLHTILKLNFKEEDFLVMSGSLPQGIKNNFYAYIIKNVRKNNILTVVDADGEVLKESINASPFLIKPNIKEIENAFGIKIKNYKDLKNFSEFLFKKGISIILLTLGEKGAILIKKDQIYYAKAPKINFKSSIGCGDAFLSGFLYKYKRGEKIDNCLKFAVACGSAKAEEEGTKMPELKKVLKILASVNIYEKIPSNIFIFKNFPSEKKKNNSSYNAV